MYSMWESPGSPAELIHSSSYSAKQKVEQSTKQRLCVKILTILVRGDEAGATGAEDIKAVHFVFPA